LNEIKPEFMKKIIVILSVILFIQLSNSSVYAQLFLKAGVGYGLGIQKLVLDQSYTATATENIYGSFGGSWGFYLGGGIGLNKFVEFEADLGYQNGRSAMVENGLSSKNFVGRLIYFNPSLTFKTAIDENISPYAKIGLITGLPLTKVIVYNQENKFRGGIPLGINEALGLNFNATDNLKFFVELYHQSMIYKPTKRKEADGTIVQFKDVLPYPYPANEEMSHHLFSFGALGLNLGIKFVL
jgi:hypothetical protein